MAASLLDYDEDDLDLEQAVALLCAIGGDLVDGDDARAQHINDQAASNDIYSLPDYTDDCYMSTEDFVA
ncbi:hypothetical protein LTR35_011094 [Friedmanniomyces endolithicus]|uniref:Uncharacterized protein n=1 Tax=Friedmanniomyces endolithicus TaxID=329885 RepID=A0AAN6FUT4_9PEZI|nr:hypothetical protein LTR35_011094 [Friedmanniomyces endolithicus]KAK0277300.1 hypothetical protein LTS00_014273 [Friedmanniomyces endolithicus]KAK0323721.1 hypothetical protein LTR82_005468 [Friedmanniomyces endolithicus]KAK1019001.1 hypothetical protein LTR54_000814 [Friedmanniomyces endolithicus]